MKKPNQRIGADVVKSDLVELYKSTSNKSATYALHFDTEETNQFCDFTENIQNLISASKSCTWFRNNINPIQLQQ